MEGGSWGEREGGREEAHLLTSGPISVLHLGLSRWGPRCEEGARGVRQGLWLVHSPFQPNFYSYWRWGLRQDNLLGLSLLVCKLGLMIVPTLAPEPRPLD